MAAAFSLNPFLARESCNLVCAARPLLKAVAHHVRRDVSTAVAEDALLHHWPSIRGAMAILQQCPVTVALRSYQGPTTFVHGTADAVTPIERIMSLAREIAADVLTIEGGHHSYLKHRDELMALVRSR
jgi:pimeloyl-ACP methyl ester carboxylesterase